ncbi:unnamed protein product, partial [Ceratitis capitata]
WPTTAKARSSNFDGSNSIRLRQCRNEILENCEQAKGRACVWVCAMTTAATSSMNIATKPHAVAQQQLVNCYCQRVARAKDICIINVHVLQNQNFCDTALGTTKVKKEKARDF